MAKAACTVTDVTPHTPAPPTGCLVSHREIDRAESAPEGNLNCSRGYLLKQNHLQAVAPTLWDSLQRESKTP